MVHRMECDQGNSNGRGFLKYLVERHVIKATPEIVRLCTISKELYNKCNYYMRKQWFNNLENNDWSVKLPDIVILKALVKKEKSFNDFGNQKIAMQTIRMCLFDWSAFRNAITAYKKDKSKFAAKPQMPYYKKKMAQVVFYNQTIKGGMYKKQRNDITPTNGCFSINSDRKYKQVVLAPKTFGFVIEVQYEQEIQNQSKELGICNIDMGLNNLCAITSDQHSPLLINGRIVKSINQQFNKLPNRRNSGKRYWQLENYFHHTSKFIIDNCIKHKIGIIIIGKNDGWKQNINMGKRNNQNFCSVPFCNLIQKIKYKAELVGLTVIFTEESYTSKASFLDRDPLPAYKHGVHHEFSGCRVKRGLYKSKGGILLNADVNGSANIGRKVIKDIDIINRLDRSVAATPVRINPLKVFM